MAWKRNAGAIALRSSYLRVVGLEIDADGAGTGTRRVFTPEEEEEFSHMSRSQGFYDRFAASIAPSIYGNLGQRHPALPALVD